MHFIVESAKYKIFFFNKNCERFFPPVIDIEYPNLEDARSVLFQEIKIETEKNK